MLLEQTLVVGDTVLAEHESVESQPAIVSHIVYQDAINQFIQFHRPSSLSVDRQESPVTSRPFHQHPELCAGVESQGVSREDVPSHTGGGAKHFCGSRVLKSKAQEARRWAMAEEQNHGEVVDGGSEGSCNWRVM